MDLRKIGASTIRHDFTPQLEVTSGMSEQVAAKMPQLKYYGGKILKSPKFYSVYLGSHWQTKRGQNEVKYHDRFARTLFSSEHMKVWNEYGVKKASFIGSSTIKSPSTKRVVSESQVQELIWNEIKNNRAPKPDGNTVYTLYLPPGAVLQSSDGYSSLDGLGGYHGSFDMGGAKRVYYSALAYSSGANGIDFTGSPRQNITITASHEWAEAATDPDVNNGKLGWYDKTYGEVADIPLTMGIDLKDIAGNIGGFKVQKEWSNRDNCLEVLPGKCE